MLVTDFPRHDWAESNVLGLGTFRLPRSSILHYHCSHRSLKSLFTVCSQVCPVSDTFVNTISVCHSRLAGQVT
jgi:hypothetical protein